MMRGQKAFAVAMRAPDGRIAIHTEELAKVYRSGIAKIPFLRGVILLWDALGLGMRALTLSANTQTGEDEKLEGPALYLTLGLSLTLGIGLFFLLPAALGGWAEHWLKSTSGAIWTGNLLEGVLRLALLVGYIWAIGFMPDVRRLFGYHGAEHKTINAYEAGLDLNVANVQRQTVQHPRCGTAFLLTVVVFSIFLFAPLNVLLPYGIGLIMRIVLLPVVAMLAYEYIRFSARHLDNPIIHAITVPNLAMQKLTTREPDDTMVQVAIEALQKVLDSEQNRPLNPEYLIP
jgi:uncharacterized protein YqhQ